MTKVMSLEKPQLKPVNVPWMISPSTPFLKLEPSTSGGVVQATFAAYFKADDHNRPRDLGAIPEIVDVIPAFEARPLEEKSAYRVVRVSFEDARHFRTLPSISDLEVIREKDYDWSLAGIKKPGEKISEFLRRNAETWLRTGICPNPGMYEVLGSPWIAELSFPQPLPWHHYLLMGHDEYVEVVARAWNWEPGQALWQEAL